MQATEIKRQTRLRIPTTREINQSKENLMVRDLDLSLVVPKYKITRSGLEFGKLWVVHIRRKHDFNNLHVMAFYWACYTTFLRWGINPSSSFARTHYKKKKRRRNGKMVKGVEMSTNILPYLELHSEVDNYKGNVSVYFSVTARFCDPNSKANLGLTITAHSKNVKIYVMKKLEKRIKNIEEFDFATFFENFLFFIGYPKSAYVAAGKVKSIHRLYGLQKDINNFITEGTLQ